jgi:hypothetical protein
MEPELVATCGTTSFGQTSCARFEGACFLAEFSLEALVVFSERHMGTSSHIFS